MKVFLGALFLCFGFQAQAQLVEDFSDGDFTNNPSWSGNTSLFTITSGELQSQSSGAATYYLSTPSTLASEAIWEFYVNLKFSTSGANYVDFFLMADNADLTIAANGYFVRMGNTPDEISLYKLEANVETIIIDGTDGIVNSSSNNPFNIKVTRDAANLWTLEVDDGAFGVYTVEGITSDNSITTSTHFGLLVEQSSAAGPINNHFFDNFSVGAIPVDNTPPAVSVVSVTSITQLDVKYDEAVELNTAETIANYSVDGGIGSPATALRDNSDNSLVHLTFAAAFTNNQNYTLTVQNVEDISGNAISAVDKSFTFFIAEQAANKDVRINEIFADPIPMLGLPDAEFVELYNVSNKYIDLQNYTLSGAEIADIEYILEPGSFVILCDDSDAALFQSYGDVLQVNSWNILTNTGETVTLKDENNDLVIDEVNYDLDLYNDEEKEDGGYSLELINPESACTGKSNWLASTDANGGTPGEQNSVYDTTPDTTIPQLLKVWAAAQDSIVLQFSEAITTPIAAAVFQFNPSLSIAEVSIDETIISINLSSNLSTSTVYNLSVSDVGDCAGNIISTPEVSAFRLPDEPLKKDIIINEFMPDPFDQVGLPEAEFIELYNRSGKYFNLANFTINGKEITSTYTELAPQEYIILCPDDYVVDYLQFGNTVGLVSWDALTNSGEKVSLYYPSTFTTVDQLTYSTSWYNSSVKDDGGYSLELIDPENECSSKDNWTASTDASGGTPGKENAVFASKPDLAGPTIENAVVVDIDTVLITFSEDLDSLSLVFGDFSIDNGIGIQSRMNVSLKQTKLVLQNAPEANILYTVTVNNVTDCSGNIISTEGNTYSFVVPETAAPGDIVLNEVLFNARTGAPDFVELYNNSSKYIDLQNWLLANRDDSLKLDNLKLITEEPYVLYSQSYVVLTKDPAELANQYPAGKPENFLEIVSIPSYTDTQGEVILLKPDSSIYEEFDYNEDMHHDLLTDVDGVSLERININGPTNDPENWHSAASTILATPGYLNSQTSIGVIATDVITISPKVFVPNLNGMNDYTTIKYAFEKPGYVVSVLIIDARGRAIKTITQNTTLPISGEFRWDGTTEKGTKARIGQYLVYVEAFDTSGNVKQYRERVVIGSDW